MKTRLIPVLALIASALVAVPQTAHAWGFTVHRMVNAQAAQILDGDFAGFARWSAELETLAVAADQRKSSDPDERIRHFIDIDDYPEFFTGGIPQDFDTMVATYGRSRVEDNGILPWAIRDTYDRLVAAFAAGEWEDAVALAGDIGHYVADLHNPMHLTVNFNGQLTGQHGIHARHESEMTERYLPQLTPSGGSPTGIPDVLPTLFDWIDEQYPGVETILEADRTAAEIAGNTWSEAYYAQLWEEVGQSTALWIARAVERVAGMWTAAWVEAGSPVVPGSVNTESETFGGLKQKYE